LKIIAKVDVIWFVTFFQMLLDNQFTLSRRKVP
jgi:hypothetical protein